MVSPSSLCVHTDMATPRNAGVDRILIKLQASVDSGNYYEAHQMYRTLYYRYSSRKKYAELLELLYGGATSLLQNQQYESGADLSNLVVDVLTKSNTAVNNETVDKLGLLFKNLNPESEERMVFLAAALKWAGSDKSAEKTGLERLHRLVAQSLWNEKSFGRAHYHYLRSTDGEGFASMLIEYNTTRGNAMEEDLFIAQAVFQFLCLKNKSTASVVFYKYTQGHPSLVKGPPYLQPLLNFLWFLLLSIDSGQLAVFTIICEKYETTLKRDPTYSQYLDRIGQLFFGVPPRKQNKSKGMIGNIINSLFQDLDESSGDEIFASSSNTQLHTEDLD
ncbi:Golgi to ER traffic protein 4 [Nymphon striatum]|nr:Golgi to ER traffic protein 4 [Nymphon striatum]KAG1707005.1 Golgi to ER traffic protein 4 [Nymphon striatum]